MPIETICQCGKRLRVADEHAGKLAKCPQCQAVYTVPQPAAAGAGLGSASTLPPDDRWHLRTDGGLTFGPVSRQELDRWHAGYGIDARGRFAPMIRRAEELALATPLPLIGEDANDLAKIAQKLIDRGVPLILACPLAVLQRGRSPLTAQAAAMPPPTDRPQN